MKLSLSSITCAVLFTASASAREAPIYLTGSINPVPEGYPLLPNLSPEHSRLVLAQRFGLSEFHKLSPWTDDLLQAINAFGGEQDHIFGSPEQRRLKAIILVEGAENPQTLLPPTFGGPRPRFTMDNPPTADANNQLLRDIYAQAASLQQSSTRDSSSAAAVLGREVNAMRSAAKSLNAEFLAATGDYIFIQSRALEKVMRDHGSSSKEYIDAKFEVRQAIEPLLENDFDALDLVLALIPPQPSGIFKRSAGSYGSYDMPSRRQLDFTSTDPDMRPGVPDTNPLIQENGSTVVGQQTPERPLPPTTQQDDDEPAQPPPGDDAPQRPTPPEDGQPPPNDQQPPENDNPPPPEGPHRDTTPPSGILKSCYSNQADCSADTHSCSGHGNCTINYSYQEGDVKKTCWACACNSDVTRNEKGQTQTTYWAGPACQKKDVSTPFWFLGGVTIFFILVISWGIGLLVQMGSQDLPSVIGAGVSSAKPR